MASLRRKESQEPHICYIVLKDAPIGKRIAIIQRGEVGYLPTNLDPGRSDIEAVEIYVKCLNDLLGVSEKEMLSMAASSMIL
jgi:hypothetical protein